jgi:hypothetical protein
MIYGPDIIVELVNVPTLYSNHRYNVTNKQEITNYLNNTQSLNNNIMRVYAGNKLLTTLSFEEVNYNVYDVVSNQSTKNNYSRNVVNRPNSSQNFSPNTCVHLALRHASHKSERYAEIYRNCNSDGVMPSPYTYMIKNQKRVYNPDSADTMGLQKAIARALVSKLRIKEPISPKVTFMRNHHGYLSGEMHNLNTQGRKLRAANQFKRAYRNTYDPNHPMMQKRFVGLQRKFNNMALNQ